MIASDNRPLRYIAAANIIPAKTAGNQFGSMTPYATEDPRNDSQVN
jgi:hypothetical protein